MSNDPNFLGYLEYYGELVDEGIMDARKSARALLGFDGAVRHFAGMQLPPLRTVDYDIPVSVRRGSWQALIPDSIEKWVLAAIGIAATKYLATAAGEVARNDFKDVDMKLIFSKALNSIQWMIRMGKHLGTLSQRRFASVVWRDSNTIVGIPNEKGDYLYVPKAVLDAYTLTPPRVLSEMASLIEPGRQLRVVVRTGEKTSEVEEIDYKCKAIFYVGEEEGDILFPELQHGQAIALEGVVTRGNENTNSIGFRYNDHILNCIPREGSIVRFKSALFLKCRISGVISRADDSGLVSQKKPKIIFDNIEPLEEEPPSLSLFGE